MHERICQVAFIPKQRAVADCPAKRLVLALLNSVQRSSLGGFSRVNFCGACPSDLPVEVLTKSEALCEDGSVANFPPLSRVKRRLDPFIIYRFFCIILNYCY
jgi:hypothetical protein